MLFNSLDYWIFFAAVLVMTFTVPAAWSRAVIVAASFIFYGMWNPAFTLLLAGCIAANYATGIAIGQSAGRRRWFLLGLAVGMNLGVLAFFKYTAFLAGSFTSLLDIHLSPFVMHIVLPVAISFYTFEAISYNVDIYRRALAARTNLVDFALFMSFFPHLVAGPIIRPANFFPQLQGRPVPDGDDIRWGVLQIVKGLIKKAVFADNFAIAANAYFNGPIGHAGLAAAWLGTLSFSLQIYFDFSGYTDIARGCAQLLGYRFPPNFERPYLAADITAFWRRWHISLSTWLRDYLYIPLGGNRHGTARTYVNILATMGLGGLWHGASWNFAAWGLYHGALLIAHRLWQATGWANAMPGPAAIRHGAAVAFTFVLVTIGWVTFRAPDFATSWHIFGELFGGSLSTPFAVPREILVLMLASATWLVLDRDRRLQAWLSQARGLRGTLGASSTLAASLTVLELFSRTDIAVPFIYFQF